MLKPSFSQNALRILRARYLRRDKQGKIIETPEEMLHRVANNVALADAKYLHKDRVKSLQKSYKKNFWQLTQTKSFTNFALKDEQITRTAQTFYEMMAKLEFLPNSPCLFNAGTKLQQLAACFVLPVEDHIDAIFESIKNCALIHRSGGGTGFDFSKLRPSGEYLDTTGGSAAGPLAFMKVFDAATMQVKQAGKRQGANMGILRVDHPNILDFIEVKGEQHILTNFNISVAITDSFMEAVKKDEFFFLRNPQTKEPTKKIKARTLLGKIADAAKRNADPGVVFITRINQANPTPKVGKIRATNPCAEMPLLPFEACNLGSVNVAKHVKGGQIDWEHLKTTIHNAIHFLDNMIDVSAYPLPEIMGIVHQNRKIGLGVMGFADLLFQINLSYESKEARQLASKLMNFINTEAKLASVELAKVRGVFSNFKGSRYDTGNKEDRVRNATRTAISPTGTISLLANCSSSIEPLYALAYSRPIIGQDKPLVVMNKYLLKELKKQGLYTPPILDKLGRRGTIGGIARIPEETRQRFVTAMEISPKAHVLMQAAFQKHVDNAVSKTVNLPATATSKEVEEVFLLAYKSGCKGITVYVDKSREGQILTTGKHDHKRCTSCGR